MLLALLPTHSTTLSLTPHSEVSHKKRYYAQQSLDMAQSKLTTCYGFWFALVFMTVVYTLSNCRGSQIAEVPNLLGFCNTDE